MVPRKLNRNSVRLLIAPHLGIPRRYTAIAMPHKLHRNLEENDVLAKKQNNCTTLEISIYPPPFELVVSAAGAELQGWGGKLDNMLEEGGARAAEGG